MEAVVEMLEKKINEYKQEVNQYILDLKMWQTAHGAEYPLRRIEEIKSHLEEIEAIKPATVLVTASGDIQL